MFKLTLFTIALFFLTGCSGCACAYEDVPFKATILSIRIDTARPVYKATDTGRKDFYAVKLVTNIAKRDTLYLDNMIARSITNDFLDQHHLTEGKILEGTAHLITSGSCPPAYYYFSDSTLNNRQ